MTLILAHKGRKLVRDLTIKDADGESISPGANDVLRVKIGRRGAAPILDLDSAAPSANGSTITKNVSGAKNRLEIDQDDMNLLEPGIYTLEFGLVDNADAQALKHVDHQVFAVQGTMTGDVGIN